MTSSVPHGNSPSHKQFGSPPQVSPPLWPMHAFNQFPSQRGFSYFGGAASSAAAATSPSFSPPPKLPAAAYATQLRRAFDHHRKASVNESRLAGATFPFAPFGIHGRRNSMPAELPSGGVGSCGPDTKSPCTDSNASSRRSSASEIGACSDDQVFIVSDIDQAAVAAEARAEFRQDLQRGKGRAPSPMAEYILQGNCSFD